MKPGVFTQLYVQLVFAVEGRACLLRNQIHNEEIFKYISGSVSGQKCKSLIVNGVHDHIHVFVGLHHTLSISDLVWEIKRSSSLFINEKKWYGGNFSWQNGYGAFSYGRSQIDDVYKYIQNQQTHHQRSSFKTEYMALLKKFDIEFDKSYLFKFIDE